MFKVIRQKPSMHVYLAEHVNIMQSSLLIMYRSYSLYFFQQISIGMGVGKPATLLQRELLCQSQDIKFPHPIPFGQQERHALQRIQNDFHLCIIVPVVQCPGKAVTGIQSNSVDMLNLRNANYIQFKKQMITIECELLK